jgi:hypothetical protein
MNVETASVDFAAESLVDMHGEHKGSVGGKVEGIGECRKGTNFTFGDGTTRRLVATRQGPYDGCMTANSED